MSELVVTGNQIVAALTKQHGAKTQEHAMTIDTASHKMHEAIDKGSPLAAMWYYRKVWATGALRALVGDDIWEMDGYRRMTLDELFVRGKLQSYRELPPQVIQIMADFD